MSATRTVGFQTSRRTFVAAGTAALAAVVTHPAIGHVIAPAPISGFELPQPMALKPFRLIDHRAKPFGPDRLQARWTLLLFGFTHCPDVCPTTLSQVAQVRSHVRRIDASIPTASVFVTIDPARDSPARLTDYVAQFGDDLVGLTGAKDEIEAFARQFRIRYAPTKHTGASGYLFDHTASVSALGPDGRLHAIFTLPLRAEKVAADIARMQHHAVLTPILTGSADTPACNLEKA